MKGRRRRAASDPGQVDLFGTPPLDSTATDEDRTRPEIPAVEENSAGPSFSSASCIVEQERGTSLLDAASPQNLTLAAWRQLLPILRGLHDAAKAKPAGEEFDPPP